MERKEFEGMVRKALKALPKQFKDRLENVDVVIEDEADIESARKLGLGSKGRILGLYQGVPLKERAHYYGMVMPDKITLFKNSIERSCAEAGKDIYGEVKHVLEHEIAHHFGISDKRLRDTGTY